MFLLDTNVISELRRPKRTNPNVAAWADGVPPTELFLSSITVLELEVGVRRLAHRDASAAGVIRRWIDDQVLAVFGDRILPVDTEVATHCASFHVPNPRPYRDSLIAATALVHRLTLVTRNSADFQTMRVALLDPWH